MTTLRTPLRLTLVAALLVTRAARAEEPPLPPLPSASATPAGSVTLNATAPGVFVELRVPPSGTTTFRGRPPPDEWHRVCELPCTVPVDPAGTYRVDGDGISASREFRLAGPATLLVESDATWKKNVGMVGIGVGAIAIITSSALFLRASDLFGEADRIDAGPPGGASKATGGAPAFGSTNAESRRASARSDQTFGFVLLGAGAAVLIGGIVSLVLYDGTRVTRDNRGTARAADDAFSFTF